MKKNLTSLQNNIFTAIETNNIGLFIDLGGRDSIDLNFYADVSPNWLSANKENLTVPSSKNH